MPQEGDRVIGTVVDSRPEVDLVHNIIEHFKILLILYGNFFYFGDL